MEARLPKSEILQRLEVEHKRLAATLARLTPEQMVEPGVVGYWSVKDVLAHLIYWNVYASSEMNAAVDGREFAHPLGTTDEINAQAVMQYSWLDLNTIRAGFETSFNNIREGVQKLPDSAFEPDNPIERALDETIHGALANNTYEHWPIHEQQIRDWIEQN